jgi:thymidine kinase
MSGKLELIIGPMFSGKSTELIRQIKKFKAINKNILVIKPKIDDRYAQLKIVSHNNESENCIVFENLDNIDYDIFSEYEIIIIDEAQFFTNLKQFVLHLVEILNLYVIIGGLDGDYKREPFGEILDLIPYADDYKKLTAFCKYCNDGSPAIFTKRIINDNAQILVGSSESYLPLCRLHYTTN